MTPFEFCLLLANQPIVFSQCMELSLYFRRRISAVNGILSAGNKKFFDRG